MSYLPGPLGFRDAGGMTTRDEVTGKGLSRRALLRAGGLGAGVTAAGLGLPGLAGATEIPVRRGYAPVNGLHMYYEIHGRDTSAAPLLLVHGSFMSTEQWGPLLATLARTRQVIVFDQQAHGRTADVDRPLVFETMADDAAALLGHLGIAQADVVGHSLGGGVVFQVAIRHPDRVRTLVSMSAPCRRSAFQPEFLEGGPVSPEDFVGTQILEVYERVAPRPEDFPILVDKINGIDARDFDWTDGLSALAMPTMIVVSDADIVPIEHAAEMLRLIGGGGWGDIVGIPGGRLAVPPGTSHHMPVGVGMLDRHEWLSSMILEFHTRPGVVPPPY